MPYALIEIYVCKWPSLHEKYLEKFFVKYLEKFIEKFKIEFLQIEKKRKIQLVSFVQTRWHHQCLQ